MNIGVGSLSLLQGAFLPGIEPGSPALKLNSLPPELPGKPWLYVGEFPKEKKKVYISAFLLPSGNGGNRKTAACIWRSLRVKYCSAQRCWHHLTLPRRRALASLAKLANHRPEDGLPQLPLCFSLSTYGVNNCKWILQFDSKTLFLLAFGGKNFFFTIYENTM